MNANQRPALEAIRAVEVGFINTRHPEHANPKLGLQAVATGDLLAKRLQRWGCKAHHGPGTAGVLRRLPPLTGGEDLAFLRPKWKGSCLGPGARCRVRPAEAFLK